MVKLTPAREALIAALFVMLLHALARLPIAPGAFQDDAIYLGLGRALADGAGWHSIYTPGAPVHLKYPPGLPALYALCWIAGGTLGATLRLVHAFHLLVAGTAAGLVWWIVRARLHGGTAPALAALAPFGLVSLIDYLQLPIAEGPFLAAWLGALALALGPLTARRALALGLLLALATLLRTQGVAVIAGVIAGLLLARREGRLVAIAAAAAVVPVLAWWIVHAALVAAGPVSTQPDEAGYLAWLGADTLLRAAWINLRTYWAIVPRELGPAGWGHVVLLLAGTLAVLGARRGGRRLMPLTASAALSLALVVAWPYTQSRLVLALAPVLMVLTVAGWPAVPVPGRRRAVPALTLLVFALVGARQLAVREAAHAHDPGATVGFHPIGSTLVANSAWMVTVAPWVMGQTPSGTRLLTEGAAGLWLVTHRVGVTAVPATPNTGATTPPATYLAERLVEDSLTVVIASSAGVLDGLAQIERRCPGTLLGGAPIGDVATAYAVSDSGRRCLAVR